MTDHSGPIPGTFLERILTATDDVAADRELIAFVRDLLGCGEVDAGDAMRRYAEALEMAQAVIEVRDSGVDRL